MAEPFMPFRPPQAAATPAGVTSRASSNSTSSAAATGFAPLTPASAVPPAATPSVAPPPPSPAATPTTPASTALPKITLQRDGERVAQIRVQCNCGHIIDLECEY